VRRSALLLVLLLVSAGPRYVPHRPFPAFDDPDEAASLFAAKRGITRTTNLHALYATARAAIDANASTIIGPWAFLGPGNIGGRTRALLIDPADPNTMYAGAVSGGVWKTTNGGASWYAVSDAMANLAVCSLAFDPSDSRTIYAGTGEGYFREDVRGTNLPITGDGIFVTHDGGGNWTQLPSTINDDFHFVNDLGVSAHDPHRIYAATRSGVWRSLDGGGSWSNVLATTVKGGCLDLALRNDTANDFVFASCGTFEQATVYRATTAESDAAWEAVLTDPKMARTSIAIAPSNPSVIYAMAAANGTAGGYVDQGLFAVFRSDKGGAPGTWIVQARGIDSNTTNRDLLSNALAVSCTFGGGNGAGSTMGWHANVIAVDPVDANRVWAGGVDLFRSDDGGRTWGAASYWWPDDMKTPTFAHADQHVIVFDPGFDGAGNQRMIVANDGGMQISDNARAAVANSTTLGLCSLTGSSVHFTSLNHDYGATQFYSGAVFPDGRRWLGGAQDNGTLIGGTAGGVNGWEMIFPGDGGEVAIHPTTPSTVFAEYQWAFLGRSDDGGQSFQVVTNGLSDRPLFVTPYAIDPDNGSDLWLGGTMMWRTPNGGANWLQASTKLNGTVSAIAVARGRDRVIAGTTTGIIVRNDAASAAKGTTEWASSQPRAGWVSSVAFDATNTDTIYATYADFGGGPHVWRSLDAGATWTAIDGSDGASIPDIPVHSITADGSRLFAGTDLGVFVSYDAGAHWLADRNFPKVITERVVVAQGVFGPALYAFTHGRGAWRAELALPPKHRAAGR